MRYIALGCLGLLAFVACGGDDDAAASGGEGGAVASGATSGSSAQAGTGRGGVSGAGVGGSATGGSATGGSATGGSATGGTAGTPVGGASGATATGGTSGRAGGATGGTGVGGASGRGTAGRAGGSSGSAGADDGGASPGGSGSGEGSAYDRAVLADGPVAYLAMNKPSGTEPDLTGNGRDGTHQGGTVPLVKLPNGDDAGDLDGEGQYVSIPSHAAFSIPTTHDLTWEAWIRPDVLQFPNDSNGYVNWMGKCQNFAGSCEWEARMYTTTNGEDRCNRISAYVFNESAGLGSAADWQPECGLIEAGEWYHVVGEYTTDETPDDCDNADDYPGGIEIWVNGVKWDHGSHGQTGCMSQYDVIPEANDSPVNIGTNSKSDWFPGAIAKVAFYDKLLPESAILEHYQLMTGETPVGSCGGDCNFDP